MKIYNLCFVFLLPLFLSSCIQANLAISLKDDMSGTATFSAVFSQDGKELLKEMAGLDEELDKSILQNTNFNKTMNFEKIEEFGDLIEHKFEKDTHYVSINLNKTLDQKNVGELKLYLDLLKEYMKDTYLEIDIKTPKKITKHNKGDLKDDKNLIYKVNIIQLLTNPDVLEFSF